MNQYFFRKFRSDKFMFEKNHVKNIQNQSRIPLLSDDYCDVDGDEIECFDDIRDEITTSATMPTFEPLKFDQSNMEYKNSRK